MPVLRTRQSDADGLSVDMERPSPPIIPYDVFLGLNWAWAAIAVVVLCARLFARYRSLGRFYLDDVFIALSCSLVVAPAALWQWRARDMYYTLHVNAGTAAFEANYLTRMHDWLVVTFVAKLFYYTSLILFKLSMLVFFKRLGQSVHRFGYLWWPVFLFALSTYVISIGNMEYRCLLGDSTAIVAYCDTPEATNFLKNTLVANAALDVFSDFLIMIIPINLLWKVQIPWRKKLIFIAIFSLSLIIIGIAIARAADIESKQKSNGRVDVTYLLFWSNLQTFLCILVACSSSFRGLFTASARSQDKPVWTPTASYYQRAAVRFRSGGQKPSDISLYDMSHGTQVASTFGYVTMQDSEEALNDGAAPGVPPRAEVK